MPHRSSVRRVAAVCAVAAIGLIATSTVVPSLAATATLRTTATVGATPALAAAARVLTSNVLPGIASLASPGALPADRSVSIGLALARPDPSGEQALLAAIYDPSSPQFGHYLTPEAFAGRFGVPAVAAAQAVAWLRAGGLTVDQVATARDWITATGTATQIERRFGVALRTYSLGGAQFFANTTAPAVPAGLPIVAVVGLNSLQHFTPFHTAPAARLLPDIFLQTPQDLWSVYQQPASNRGAGQTMAIFGEGATTSVIKDLRQFEKQFRLPQIPVVVKHVGNGPFSDTSGNGEWDIDMQASAGMAPDAKQLVLYFAASLSDADVLGAFHAWVDDANGPRQANASFGECETSPLNPITGNPILNPTFTGPLAGPGQGLGNNMEPAGEAVLRQAAMAGKTLFSATGDTGSSCPIFSLPVIGAGNGILNHGLPLLNYPAASAYAVAVGGTVLYTNGLAPPARARSLERAWEFGGGGSSPFITAPFWQSSVAASAGRCLMTPAGRLTNFGRLCRSIPDVAAISGDIVSNGYSTVMDGVADSAGGGTSLSSPLWMGMWARVQAASVRPGGTGFAAPAIYRAASNAASYSRDFFDVALGTNGLHVAGRGWDETTGWGTPRLTGLIADIDGRAH